MESVIGRSSCSVYESKTADERTPSIQGTAWFRLASSDFWLSLRANRPMRSSNTDYPHEGRIGPEKRPRVLHRGFARERAAILGNLGLSDSLLALWALSARRLGLPEVSAGKAGVPSEAGGFERERKSVWDE